MPGFVGRVLFTVVLTSLLGLLTHANEDEISSPGFESVLQQIVESMEGSLLVKTNKLRNKPLAKVLSKVSIYNDKPINAFVKSRVFKGNLEIQIFVNRGLLEKLFAGPLTSGDKDELNLAILRLRGVIAHEMMHPVDKHARKADSLEKRYGVGAKQSIELLADTGALNLTLESNIPQESVFEALKWVMNLDKPVKMAKGKLSKTVLNKTENTHPDSLLRESVLRVATTLSSFFEGEVENLMVDQISWSVLERELNNFPPYPSREELSRYLSPKLSDLGIEELSYKQAYANMLELLEHTEPPKNQDSGSTRKEKNIPLHREGNEVYYNLTESELLSLKFSHYFLTIIEKVPNRKADIEKVASLMVRFVKENLLSAYGFTSSPFERPRTSSWRRVFLTHDPGLEEEFNKLHPDRIKETLKQRKAFQTETFRETYIREVTEENNKYVFKEKEKKGYSLASINEFEKYFRQLELREAFKTLTTEDLQLAIIEPIVKEKFTSLEGFYSLFNLLRELKISDWKFIHHYSDLFWQFYESLDFVHRYQLFTSLFHHFHESWRIVSADKFGPLRFKKHDKNPRYREEPSRKYPAKYRSVVINNSHKLWQHRGELALFSLFQMRQKEDSLSSGSYLVMDWPAIYGDLGLSKTQAAQQIRDSVRKLISSDKYKEFLALHSNAELNFAGLSAYLPDIETYYDYYSKAKGEKTNTEVESNPIGIIKDEIVEKFGLDVYSQIRQMYIRARNVKEEEVLPKSSFVGEIGIDHFWLDLDILLTIGTADGSKDITRGFVYPLIFPGNIKLLVEHLFKKLEITRVKSYKTFKIEIKKAITSMSEDFGENGLERVYKSIDWAELTTALNLRTLSAARISKSKKREIALQLIAHRAEKYPGQQVTLILGLFKYLGLSASELALKYPQTFSYSINTKYSAKPKFDASLAINDDENEVYAKLLKTELEQISTAEELMRFASNLIIPLLAHEHSKEFKSEIRYRSSKKIPWLANLKNIYEKAEALTWTPEQALKFWYLMSVYGPSKYSEIFYQQNVQPFILTMDSPTEILRQEFNIKKNNLAMQAQFIRRLKHPQFRKELGSHFLKKYNKDPSLLGKGTKAKRFKTYLSIVESLMRRADLARDRILEEAVWALNIDDQVQLERIENLKSRVNFKFDSWWLANLGSNFASYTKNFSRQQIISMVQALTTPENNRFPDFFKKMLEKDLQEDEDLKDWSKDRIAKEVNDKFEELESVLFSTEWRERLLAIDILLNGGKSPWTKEDNFIESVGEQLFDMPLNSVEFKRMRAFLNSRPKEIQRTVILSYLLVKKLDDSNVGRPSYLDYFEAFTIIGKKSGQEINTWKVGAGDATMDELRELKDNARPMSKLEIVRMVNNRYLSLAKPSPIKSYDSIVSAASVKTIAKVTLHNGEERALAVRVSNPERLIFTQIKYGRRFLEELEKEGLLEEAEFVKNILTNLERQMYREVDFSHEIQHHREIKKLLESLEKEGTLDSSKWQVLVPKLDEKNMGATDRMYLMEYIHGAQAFDRLDRSTQEEVGPIIVKTYLQMMFRGFANGNPHVANFLIRKEDNKIYFIDFGQALELEKSEVMALAQFLYGVGTESPKQVAMALEAMSTIRPDSLNGGELYKKLDHIVLDKSDMEDKLLELIKVVMSEGVELNDAFLVYSLKGLLTLSKESFVDAAALKELLTEEVGRYLISHMDEAISAQRNESSFAPEKFLSQKICGGALTGE